MKSHERQFQVLSQCYANSKSIIRTLPNEHVWFWNNWEVSDILVQNISRWQKLLLSHQRGPWLCLVWPFVLAVELNKTKPSAYTNARGLASVQLRSLWVEQQNQSFHCLIILVWHSINQRLGDISRGRCPRDYQLSPPPSLLLFVTAVNLPKSWSQRLVCPGICFSLNDSE